MSGVFGWLGVAEGDPARRLAAMARRASGPAKWPAYTTIGRAGAIGAAGPRGTAFAGVIGSVRIGLFGHPFWLEECETHLPLQTVCARLADAYRRIGEGALQLIGGDFVLALLDDASGAGLLAVDRMGVRNLTYCQAGDAVIFAPGSDVLATHPAAPRDVDPQGIYNYLHFHVVPSPNTIIIGQHRLSPGHYLAPRQGAGAARRYFHAEFDEHRRVDERELVAQFRSVLRLAVGTFGAAAACGAFLSGGTDSSTISGILGETSAAPVHTFSIGFEANGYDEMEYARIAAAHFGADHHEYYVTPADVVSAVPIIAAAFSQPFGNASAVPTYYCAKLAQEHGMARILGGDGGDELFGGNSRYAKQYQFSLYERLPGSLRRGAIEPLLIGLPAVARMPLLRKARSYVAQARLPMPERYDTYNLLERLGARHVLQADFLASIDVRRPANLMREEFAAASAQSLINRMLALDFRFTLADNDLPKVTYACEAAGIDVAFPMLHESVVAFAARLEPSLKLRGTKLRYFFKRALADFLPRRILTKTKHGFGLPVGLWLRSYAPLRNLAADSLDALKARGIVRREFIDELLDARLDAHAAYYGTLIWVLMMLELWHQHHVDTVREDVHEL